MRCLVEGEPAARGGRAQHAPWPWTTLAARSLRTSSWDFAGRQPGQVPAASRAQATPSAGQRPASYWLWQLEVAGGGLHFCLQVGRRARRGQPPLTPQEGPLTVGLWCSQGSARPATGSCQTCASGRKTGEQGSPWKKQHTRLILLSASFLLSDSAPQWENLGESVNKAAFIRVHRSLVGSSF